MSIRDELRQIETALTKLDADEQAQQAELSHIQTERERLQKEAEQLKRREQKCVQQISLLSLEKPETEAEKKAFKDEQRRLKEETQKIDEEEQRLTAEEEALTKRDKTANDALAHIARERTALQDKRAGLMYSQKNKGGWFKKLALSALLIGGGMWGYNAVSSAAQSSAESAKTRARLVQAAETARKAKAADIAKKQALQYASGESADPVTGKLLDPADGVAAVDATKETEYRRGQRSTRSMLDDTMTWNFEKVNYTPQDEIKRELKAAHERGIATNHLANAAIYLQDATNPDNVMAYFLGMQPSSEQRDRMTVMMSTGSSRELGAATESQFRCLAGTSFNIMVGNYAFNLSVAAGNPAEDNQTDQIVLGYPKANCPTAKMQQSNGAVHLIVGPDNSVSLATPGQTAELSKKLDSSGLKMVIGDLAYSNDIGSDPKTSRIAVTYSGKRPMRDKMVMDNINRTVLKQPVSRGNYNKTPDMSR